MHQIEHPQHTFEAAAEERSFSGGVVHLSHGGDVKLHQAFGTTAYHDAISRPVTTQTLYDIASISKLFTATATLVCARENNISIDEKIARFLPALEYSMAREVTIRQLLNHTSGLGIEVQSLHKQPTENWVRQIADAPLRDTVGNSVRYSCTNYFLLGRLVEIWTKNTLDNWIENRLFRPLHMTRTTFRPLIEYSLDEIAPCEIDAETSEAWHGVAHDEAARVWMQEQGSASGNSGMFSTAENLSKFAQLWLQDGAWNGVQIVHPDDTNAALTQIARAEHYDQGLGWHLDVSSWMGLRAPKGTAGHAGFTGPTLWIEPSHLESSTRSVCIVLNNRVYPSRDSPLRFKYHRRIAEWLRTS
jgi:CubicO group peptidase (beta-lactamase class C family)